VSAAAAAAQFAGEDVADPAPRSPGADTGSAVEPTEAHPSDAPDAVTPPRKPRVPRKTKKKRGTAREVFAPASPRVEEHAARPSRSGDTPTTDDAGQGSAAEPPVLAVTERADEAAPDAIPHDEASLLHDAVDLEPAGDPVPEDAARKGDLEPAGDPEPAGDAEPAGQPEPSAGATVGAPLDIVTTSERDSNRDADAASVLELEEVEEDVSAAPAASDLDAVAIVPLIEAEPEVTAGSEAVALRLRDVSKSFGETKAVDSIDLTVEPGTFYGIVGPNGAGKTTTLSMATGLLRPDHGTIEVAGVDLGADPARAKRLMGVLPDRLRTFDRLTGRQLLHYYGVLRGLRPAVVESRVADLARAFDLTDALGRTVADYSAGMTKKVMLAGAMIHSPRVLVLDEPFESVDPVSSAVILDILKAYVAHGGTVVLSSHGMDLVERVCSGVAVIVAGQVLAEGTVEEVRGELTLEQRFIELSGGLTDVEGLEWLHTFSG
jgi:ABC-2 type transport system ATP-binding protein